MSRISIRLWAQLTHSKPWRAASEDKSRFPLADSWPRPTVASCTGGGHLVFSNGFSEGADAENLEFLVMRIGNHFIRLPVDAE